MIFALLSEFAIGASLAVVYMLFVAAITVPVFLLWQTATARCGRCRRLHLLSQFRRSATCRFCGSAKVM